MKIIADTHTHSLATDHAYSTIHENSVYASEIGLKILCMTEHTPLMPGGPTELHFITLKKIPRRLNGVFMVRGAEVNIMNIDGEVDLPNNILENLEWVIGSLHTPVYKPADKDTHTQTWLNIAKNPHIDVIGHCGDGRYDFDHDVVIKAFAEYGKIVEINSHSFDDGVRQGSNQNCPEIAKKCAEYGVPIVISSDAHFYTEIADFGKAIDMLKEIDFPEELVLNADYDRFMKTLNKINGGKISER